MAKKIAGEYIAELDVVIDKKAQKKTGDNLFKQHVANLKKQNTHTIKQSQLTGENSAKAENKGFVKGSKKTTSKIGGAFKLLSKIALVGEKFVKGIPVIGQFASILSSVALAGRFLSYDPKSTLDSVDSFTKDAKGTTDFANLIGAIPSEIKSYIDTLQHKGLTKEEAINLLQSSVRKTGSFVNSDNYINEALSSFSKGGSLIEKEAIAKAYGLSPNTLASLQTYDQLKNQTYSTKDSKGNIITRKISEMEPVQNTTVENENIKREAGFNIVTNQQNLDTEYKKEQRIVKDLNNEFSTLLKSLEDFNKIEIGKFENKINTIDTQVKGYKITTDIGIAMDKIVGAIGKGTTDTNVLRQNLINKVGDLYNLLVENKANNKPAKTTTPNYEYGSLDGKIGNK